MKTQVVAQTALNDGIGSISTEAAELVASHVTHKSQVLRTILELAKSGKLVVSRVGKELVVEIKSNTKN